MNFGVPFETHGHEHRVGLTPFGVSRLKRRGHEVFVEHDAGVESHFQDEDYTEAGATIVFGTEEVYQRGEIICRVGALDLEAAELAAPGNTICAFHHLAVRPREVISLLQEKQASLIGYEILEDQEGDRPLLKAFSELAGQMAIHTAAHLLEYEAGGRGLLLGRVAGIPPATVVILGAGTLGRTAAKMAVRAGAHVIILDHDLERMRWVSDNVYGSVVTAFPSYRNLERYSAFADVLIGAVLIPGGRAPYVVTEEMVKIMKPGSVILDLSIDQGGCVETSRPTSPDNPTFRVHDVTHYCVPNMTANAPRTASRALAINAIGFLEMLAEEGPKKAICNRPGLASGVYMYDGKITNRAAADALQVEHTPIEELVGKGA